MKTSEERNHWQGHRTMSRCLGSKALREKDTVPRSEVDVSPTILAPMGEEYNWRDLRTGHCFSLQTSLQFSLPSGYAFQTSTRPPPDDWLSDT